MTIEDDLKAFERGETEFPFKKTEEKVYEVVDAPLDEDDMPEQTEETPTKADGVKALRESGVRFYGTKRLTAGTKGTVILYIDHSWGFNTKDVVELTMRNLSDTSKMEITTIKKISHLGNSTALFINREWGYLSGEWVRFSIKLRGSMRD